MSSVAGQLRRSLENIAGTIGDVIIIVIVIAIIAFIVKLASGISGLFGGAGITGGGTQGTAGTIVPPQYGQPPGTTYGQGIIITPPYGEQGGGMVTYAGGRFYSGQRIPYIPGNSGGIIRSVYSMIYQGTPGVVLPVIMGQGQGTTLQPYFYPTQAAQQVAAAQLGIPMPSRGQTGTPPPVILWKKALQP
jgi:hypothetical protein